MERKGGNRWRTLRLGIAMKEHRAIESEGRRVGREKREKDRERARRSAKGRREWGGKVSNDEEISMT